MKNRKKSVGLLLSLLLTLLLSACNKVFDTHPYDVHVKGERNLNAKNILAIEQKQADKDTLRIAFISDTHGWYIDARDEIADLNKRTDIDFAVHCGDLTDTGTIKEFEWIRDILGGLNVPCVALIGNHDFLGTGNQTYGVMFGPMDFSFIVARTKFLCLNTNATEYDYMASVPNFDYMEHEMSSDSARFDRTVVVMHAPPYSDQFNNNVAKVFRLYLEFMPGLLCCIYGHNHNDVVENIYGDELMFYGIDCALHRNYRIMTLTSNGYEMEQVYY